MIKIVKSLEELMKLLSGAEAEPEPEADSICYCGTKNDAISTAMKMMEQMQENDCTLWALQVAAAMQVIALAISAKAVDSSGLYEEIRISLTEAMLAEPNSTRLKALLEQIAPAHMH